MASQTPFPPPLYMSAEDSGKKWYRIQKTFFKKSHVSYSLFDKSPMDKELCD